jgi:hypothetical protein
MGMRAGIFIAFSAFFLMFFSIERSRIIDSRDARSA